VRASLEGRARGGVEEECPERFTGAPPFRSGPPSSVMPGLRGGEAGVQEGCSPAPNPYGRTPEQDSLHVDLPAFVDTPAPGRLPNESHPPARGPSRTARAPTTLLGVVRLSEEGTFVDDALHHDCRGQPPDARQGRQPFVAQRLVCLEVGGRHSDEIVGISEEAFRMPYLGNRGESLFELDDRRRVLAIHGHVDQHLEAAIDRG
jgi:hypothetical protein